MIKHKEKIALLALGEEMRFKQHLWQFDNDNEILFRHPSDILAADYFF